MSDTKKPLSEELRELGREGYLGRDSVLSPTLYPRLAERAAALEAKLRAAEAERDGLRAEIEAVRATYEHGWSEIAIHLEGEIRDLTKAKILLQAERDKAVADMQWMVKKAADKKGTLDGYRELGQRLAQVEAERDNLKQLHTDADRQASELFAANLALVKERDRLAAIIARVHKWTSEENKVYEGGLESSVRNYDAKEVLELLNGAIERES